MSYLSQMAGLAWHNFVSAAMGIAVAVAVIRGFTRTDGVRKLGNFWVDMTRTMLYVLVPISMISAPCSSYRRGCRKISPATSTCTRSTARCKLITNGPMASQEIIKELGTNGGGFVNANSAAPNENPNALTNLVEMLLIFSLGAGLTYVYGKMVKDTRQGWAIFSAMAFVFFVGFGTAYWAEASGNPLLHHVGIAGGNMEGKECRFGVAASALFATVTTDTSCGAVNAMHDSFMPLGGLVPLVDMQLGEIVFGGVGSGLYGTIVFVVLTVFIAGLMVGRTPEYLGKKIERRGVELRFSRSSSPRCCVWSDRRGGGDTARLATMTNNGPHGFSEILYAFTSTNANNGRAFAGLGPNLFYNIATGVNMMFGRFAVVIPALALAGALAGKKAVAERVGTFTTHSPIFVALLLGVIVIVGALTFVPADALGPIVEHLFMLQGKTFYAIPRRLDRRPKPLALRPDDRRPRDRRLVPETRSALAGAKPGHVHRRGRRARHVVFLPGDLAATPSPASISRSPRGSGSQCCSRTLPKPSPRAAVKRKPTSCAAPIRHDGTETP